MKKITLLLIMCGTFSAMSKAQNQFPAENAEWKLRCNMHHLSLVGPAREYHLADYTISYTGENKLFNERTYHVFKEGDNILGGLSVKDQKVWLTFNWENEVLLYDFGVNVEDTVIHGQVLKDFPDYESNYYYGMFDSEPHFISVVQEVQELEGKKQIRVDSYWIFVNPDTGEKYYHFLGQDLWIEGVGSKNGFFLSWLDMGPIVVGAGWHPEYYTISLESEKELVYNDLSVPMPERPYSLNLINATDLNLSYDESSKELTVSSENPAPAVFQLIDLSGRLISQVSFSGNAGISLKGYAEGIYLFKIIRDNESVYSSKIKL